ncbi:hypothetical protein HY218_02295, partial [Candidatus Saccharibacteria bacterium]|nr:hypothetical protein [Candidatus Saccharibacteria bacterium]
MSEADPIFTENVPDPLPGDGEVTIEDERRVRHLVNNLLTDQPLVYTLEGDEDCRIHCFTKKAEFKLLNGDRIYLEKVVIQGQDESLLDSTSVFELYDVHHFTPLQYDQAGRLLIRHQSFDFSYDGSFPDDTINRQGDKTFEICPPGVKSSLREALELLASASEPEVGEDHPWRHKSMQ